MAIATVVGSMAWLGGVPWSNAQPLSPKPSRFEGEAAAVDWSHALHLHGLIEGWVSAGAVEPGPQQEKVWVTGVIGIRVTLRSSGLTLGIGDSIPLMSSPVKGRAEGHTDQGVDLVRLAREATQQALKHTNDKLRDMHLRAGVVDTGSKVNKPLALGEAGPRLQVGLQVAHSPHRILLTDHDKSRMIYRRFAPGYHGLRMIRVGGDGTEASAWVWPATALAANVSPRGQLVRLLADLSYPLSELSRVGRQAAPRLERFKVIHIVRPRIGMPVVRLVRGNHIVPSSSLSAHLLEEKARSMAGFLLSRQRPDGRVAGVYHPSSDRYKPAVAPVQDAAMLAYALGRRVAFLRKTAPGHDQLPALERAMRLATTTLSRQLLAGEASLQADANPQAAALLLMCLVESGLPIGSKAQRDALAEYLLVQLEASHLSGQKDHSQIDLDSPLALAALAGLHEQTRDKELGQRLVHWLDVFWSGSDTAALLNAQPWLAMAEFRLRRSGGLSEGADPKRWNGVTKRLSKIAGVLRRRIISTRSLVGPADVIGGFDLATKDRAASLPQPHRRSAHFAAFLGLALRQKDFVPAQEAVAGLLDAGGACRYLVQLMFDKPGCFYVRSWGDVLGGVRVTCWDNRLGVDQTAMALLAITEFQQTAQAMYQAGVIQPHRAQEESPD